QCAQGDRTNSDGHAGERHGRNPAVLGPLVPSATASRRSRCTRTPSRRGCTLAGAVRLAAGS
ncbi:MAG: hypothetical protein ACLP8S_03345, partial [Solirubrobacteraceae bacterium]